ncbi:hypothetical protein NTH44_003592 [Vibrio metoecus]|nr:hypothetical protein [Vibrio cholerae]
MNIIDLKRHWKIGALVIEDPCYMLPFKQAFEMLAKTYPQVRHTQMFESDGAVVDGKLLYEIPTIPPKTNG